MDGNDFYEGIRTVLVDRKAKPTWSYQHVKDVPRSEIDKYLSPLPKERQLKL